jgi:hypothetical protein
MSSYMAKYMCMSLYVAGAWASPEKDKSGVRRGPGRLDRST